MHNHVAFRDTLVRWILEYPFRAFLATIVVILSVYLFTVKHGVIAISQFAAWWPHGRTGTGHLVNLLSLVGLVLTTLGFWYTYLQLKFANDRVDGYRKLYFWIHKLFEEIEDGGQKEFYFYGSTILPGNISFENEEEIEWLKREMSSLFSRQDRYHHVERSAVIVPQLKRYEDTYGFFHDRYVHTFRKKYRSPAAWRSFVRQKQTEAVDFQRSLPTQFGGEKLTPMDDRYRDITNAYFFSNGKRVIFAKPLHFVNTPKVGDELEVTTPHLIGFTSTDTATVNAFHQHFMDLSGDSQRQLLHSMYSRHLVGPRFIETELRAQNQTLDPPNVTCDDLARLDHDHFGGPAATELCRKMCNIQATSRVLDVGSGLGGPARYLAAHADCEVVGIELQEDRYRWAVRVTRLLELQNQVSFILGDACQTELPDKRFTHLVSFLSILHFVEKKQFVATLANRVVPGGTVYIEDYCHRRPLTPADKLLLANTISCPDLLSCDDYRRALEHSGLVIKEWQDVTDEWAAIAHQRVEDFDKNRDEIIHLHGKDAFHAAQVFHKGVDKLFAEKVISGVRILAERKP